MTYIIFMSGLRRWGNNCLHCFRSRWLLSSPAFAWFLFCFCCHSIRRIILLRWPMLLALVTVLSSRPNINTSQVRWTKFHMTNLGELLVWIELVGVSMRRLMFSFDYLVKFISFWGITTIWRLSHHQELDSVFAIHIWPLPIISSAVFSQSDCFHEIQRLRFSRFIYFLIFLTGEWHFGDFFSDLVDVDVRVVSTLRVSWTCCRPLLVKISRLMFFSLTAGLSVVFYRIMIFWRPVVRARPHISHKMMICSWNSPLKCSLVGC